MPERRTDRLPVALPAGAPDTTLPGNVSAVAGLPSPALPAAMAHDAIADHLSTLVADTDIPLDQQTPWQRYEMASFGDNRPTAVARAAAEKSARIALQQQLSNQIASSRDQARAEGRAEGYTVGFDTGRADGLAQGRVDAAGEREQLSQLLLSLNAEMAEANTRVSRDLMALALDIAKAMLKTALPVRPELVLPVIEDAIAHLPVMQPAATLSLHPEDCTLVRSQIGAGLTANGWRLQPDASIERGGCRIETGTNQIDADTSTRWQRIAAALQLTDHWLEPTE